MVEKTQDTSIMELGSNLLRHSIPDNVKVDENELALYETHLTPQQFQALREEFFKDDKDHDGFVDRDELKTVIDKWYSHVFTATEIDLLMKKYEQKKIDFYEFVGLYCAERIEEKLIQLQDEFATLDPETANAKFVFSIYDNADEGKIHKRELTFMLRQMGKRSSEEFVNNLFSKFAKTEADSVSFDEFKNILSYLKEEKA